MYEWHGWATLRKTPEVDYNDGLDEAVLSRIRALLEESDKVSNETAKLTNANGEWHVWLAGCHNHPSSAIVDLFLGIAKAAPGSYGVLYLYDHGASENWDRLVMRRGSIHESRDEDLSPHVGLVEDAEILE